MQITYLHQYFLTPAMAGGTRSYEMARRLVSAGHSVRMITADSAPRDDSRAWRVEMVDGIEVHWLPVPYDNKMSYRKRISAFFHFAWASSVRACKFPADLIFATSTPLTISIPGLIAARWRRAPLVFEVRDLWPDVPIAMGALKNPLLRWCTRMLEKAAYRGATHIVALAPGMRRDIIEKGIDAAKISIIPNGADIEMFDLPGEDAPLRHRYPWLGNNPLVLYTGTIGKANGVDYAVRLAAEVARLDPSVRFVMIGDGAEAESVKRMASDEGILDRSMFFLGKMTKRDVGPWVTACDVMLALFSGPRVVWKDAVQNKFFDALAAGKPVANNFDGWQTQIAEKAGCGMLLDPDDPARAARELCDRLRDPKWMAASSAAARKLGREQFQRDRLAAKLDRILRGVKDGTVIADTEFDTL